jgi:hypothetical protein
MFRELAMAATISGTLVNPAKHMHLESGTNAHSVLLGKPTTGTLSVGKFTPEQPQSRQPTQWKTLMNKLESIANSSAGGDAPNAIASHWARTIMSKLRGVQLMPHGIVPSAEGGIGYYFTTHERYASVECLNTGEIIGLKKGGNLVEPDIWILNQDTLDDEISSIQIFMNH